jgi:iron complex transport system substrate-binding protein
VSAVFTVSTVSALLLATLTGCGSAGTESDPDPSIDGSPADAAEGAFPVTIAHAFGETEIPAEPQRVVAWGWGSADAVLALGVVPVAIPFQAYGGDEDGVLPWVADQLEVLGAETPTVLPDSAEAPVEAIAEMEPDLILATYSGITAEEYELLSAIAPTVAYPGEAWSTPWREVIGTTGRALGRSDGATDLLADIDAAIAAEAAEHPEFEGVTVAQTWDVGDTFYVYSPADPRVEFTEDLGFTTAPSVTELSTGESTFYFTLSHENLDQLTSDLLIAYADTQAELDAFLASAPAQAMPQVVGGAYAGVVGKAFIASVSPPTALSLTWGLADYVDLLAEAVAGL